MATKLPIKVRKARLAIAFQNCKKEREYCRAIEITPNQVTIRYGGCDVIFKMDKGRLARIGSDTAYPYLEEEDYAMLFTLARDLMSANLRGIKEAQKQSGKKKPKVTKDFSEHKQKSFVLS